MKTLLLALLSSAEIEFRPTNKEAVVCKIHKTTEHIECSKLMDSRKAHEYVRKQQLNEDREWRYVYYSPALHRIFSSNEPN